MGSVGVGVIGTGFGRAVHVPAFLLVPGASVIGVASARPDRSREVVAEFSLPRSFASWREMLECEEIHAVSVATPPALHAEMALAAFAAGKAVLCEKPMALDAGQASTMLQAAQAAGVVHFVGFEFREIPALALARELLRAGAAGPLRHVTIRWIVDSWADPARPWSWRSDRAQGGGSLGALGVHVFDYVEWLLGRVKSLAAHLSTRVTRRPDESGASRLASSEDCCQLLLELQDGTPVSVAISAVAPRGKGHWIEIYGEKKVLVVGSANLSDYGRGFGVWEGAPGSTRLRKVRLPRDLRFATEFEDGRVAPFRRLAQRFIGAIRESRLDVRPSFEDGLRAQVLLDAAVEAHQARRWVDVPFIQREEECQL